MRVLEARANVGIVWGRDLKIMCTFFGQDCPIHYALYFSGQERITLFLGQRHWRLMSNTKYRLEHNHAFD